MSEQMTPEQAAVIAAARRWAEVEKHIGNAAKTLLAAVSALEQAEEEQAATAQAAAALGLREFRVTFGPGHAGQILEAALTDLAAPFPSTRSDGWLTVWAADEGTARVRVLCALGRRWAAIYDLADGQFDESYYPAGQLAQWVADA